MNNIKDRFQQIADYKKVSIRKLEQLLYLNRGNISNISTKNGAIGSDKLSKICENMPELSIEWLLTGKGEMLKSEDITIPHNNIEQDKNAIEKLEQEVIFLKEEIIYLREQNKKLLDLLTKE